MSIKRDIGNHVVKYNFSWLNRIKTYYDVMIQLIWINITQFLLSPLSTGSSIDHFLFIMGSVWYSPSRRDLNIGCIHFKCLAHDFGIIKIKVTEIDWGGSCKFRTSPAGLSRCHTARHIFLICFPIRPIIICPISIWLRTISIRLSATNLFRIQLWHEAPIDVNWDWLRSRFDDRRYERSDVVDLDFRDVDLKCEMDGSIMTIHNNM